MKQDDLNEAMVRLYDLTPNERTEALADLRREWDVLDEWHSDFGLCPLPPRPRIREYYRGRQDGTRWFNEDLEHADRGAFLSDCPQHLSVVSWLTTDGIGPHEAARDWVLAARERAGSDLALADDEVVTLSPDEYCYDEGFVAGASEAASRLTAWDKEPAKGGEGLTLRR